MTPAVFLDRDNTIIHNDADLGDPDRVKLVQGAASAIASLRGLGYRLVVVSNQGGVARGKYTEADVDKVHERINDLIRATSGATVDRFYFCPYHPEGTVEQYRREHAWRKPAPGMLLQAAEDLAIDLGQSWMVGDQLRDVEAGLRAGVRTILLRADAEELSPLRLEQIATAHFEEVKDGGQRGPHFTARNLIEAVRIIAQQRKPEAPDEMRQREKTAKRWDAGAARTARTGRQAGGETVTPPQAVASAVTETVPPRTAPTKERPVRRFRTPGEAPPAAPEPARETKAASQFSPPPVKALPSTAEAEARAAEIADAVRRDELAAAELPAVKIERPVVQQVAAAPVETPVENPAPVTIAPPVTAPTTEPDPAPTRAETDSLQRILQELRHQRGTSEEFSATKLVAIILQVLAIVCLLGGLWLGRDSIDAFHRWIGTGILIELATIAILMIGR